MSETDSDIDENLTPPDILETATKMTNNLLPEKSRKIYEKTYEEFMDWRMKKNTTSYFENVLLVYFQEMSEKLKSPTLWTKFSMLKSILGIHHNIDMTKYSKLIAFLKRKSEGYKGKKSKTFSPDQIKKFMSEAPDKIYLFSKTALIFGIMGACRRQELYNLQFKDVQVFETTILVNIYNTKMSHSFSITGCYYESRLLQALVKVRSYAIGSQNYGGRPCTEKNWQETQKGLLFSPCIDIYRVVKLKNDLRDTSEVII
ncbi:hypothetical protein evm_000833 [Chilo suppressalis]|nr:hypothetical protein evm_000833 [Chilo suppressalis]